MTQEILIAGGGMGGLAAALACRRARWTVRLFERAGQFSEVGAGIQLGPNSTRVLREWNLLGGLSRVAAFPSRLRVFSAIDGETLGTLEFGPAFADRYGAPYASIHRADLQRLLLDAAAQAGADLKLASPVSRIKASGAGVTLLAGSREEEGDALLGADGLWSVVRNEVWSDGRPTPTGHLAYRGLVAQQDLPAALRRSEVNVWLGPRLHAVAYPVRAGTDLNVVVIVHGKSAGPAEDWDQEALAVDLQLAMGRMCTPLRDLVRAMPGWRLWGLNDRAPMGGAGDMARGRVALLGDAAHPMRPYLAQGAGMAIEDAAELGRVLAQDTSDADIPAALRRYAAARWARDARVQRRSRRNGMIFHATGPLRWGRNWAMGLLGEKLLDLPWLYGSS